MNPPPRAARVMLRHSLPGLVTVLLWGASACGATEGSQTQEEGDVVLAERAVDPPAPPGLESADTIRVRKEAAVKDSARIDPRLREVLGQHPDSVVAVLLRLEDPERVDTVALRAAGLDAGVTVGRVMTGRIAARRILDLAAVPGILSIDMAERIEVPRPPDADVGSTPNDPR